MIGVQFFIKILGLRESTKAVQEGHKRANTAPDKAF